MSARIKQKEKERVPASAKASAGKPKLRFPAFAKATAGKRGFGGEPSFAKATAGNWEEKRLGEVAEFLKGKGISKDDIVENGKNKCIRYGELYTKYDEIIDEVFSSTDVDAVDSVLSYDNDLIIPSSGETQLDIATVGCVKRKGILLGGDLNIVRLKKGNDGNFFAYYLSNYKKKEIAKFGQGHSVVHLYSTHFKNLKINLPKKEEQQKIASFLGVADEWVGNLKAQKEKIEDYKKGMMQRIFSGEVRFKDESGRDFGDWEERRLGEVFENIGGTALEKFVGESGSYKFISIGNYSKDGKFIDNGQRILLNDKTKTKLLEKNNLAMVLNDKTMTGDIIGSSILIDKNDAYIYNQRTERLICKEVVLPLFAWHYLNSKKFRKKVFSIAQGGTQIYVNFSSIKKLKFPLPPLPEQQKIAEFLTLIDKKIELKNNQITHAENWKKGLMQGLFV